MNSKPRILGIIPARAGSKGIPNKNIRLLAGKPLIHYTIQSALLSKLLDTILVSTDCQETINFSNQYLRIETPFIRPGELAMDTTPTINVIQHAIKYYEKCGKKAFAHTALKMQKPVSLPLLCFLPSRLNYHPQTHLTFTINGNYRTNR